MRITWNSLSKQPDKVQENIDKLLTQEECHDVNEMAARYSKKRDIVFRSKKFLQECDLGCSAVRKLAGVIQQRGEVLVDNACESCKDAISQVPFRECEASQPRYAR